MFKNSYYTIHLCESEGTDLIKELFAMFIVLPLCGDHITSLIDSFESLELKTTI